jgi:hypothetical protein
VGIGQNDSGVVKGAEEAEECYSYILSWDAPTVPSGSESLS